MKGSSGRLTAAMFKPKKNAVSAQKSEDERSHHAFTQPQRQMQQSNQSSGTLLACKRCTVAGLSCAYHHSQGGQGRWCIWGLGRTPCTLHHKCLGIHLRGRDHNIL